MTTLPTTKRQSSLISLRPEEIAAAQRLVVTASNRLERSAIGTYSIPKNALTVDERTMLQRRADDLAESLRPVGVKNAFPLLSDLFLGFNVRADSRKEAETKLAVFAAAVQDQPAWALEKGCRELLRRDVHWPPTSGQVRGACAAACQAERSELAHIQRVLTAEKYDVPSEEERARNIPKWKKLLADLNLGRLDKAFGKKGAPSP